MLVFGCAWKINFSENIFSWLCVLIALTRKLVLVKIFTSNHFWTHAQRERERERERAQIMPSAKIMPLTSLIYESIYEPMNRSSIQSLQPTSLGIRRQPRAFAPWTHELISLCDFDFLCDFDRPTNWSTFLWFWIFTFSLWSLIFFIVVVVVWVVVFWWFSCCVVVGFVWVVVENSIFKMLPNTWKYFLEQFS